MSHFDAAHISVMSRKMREAITVESSRNDEYLPDIMVPKLTAGNFNYWNTAFTSVVVRKTILADTSLDKLLRDIVVGNYRAVWSTRDEKLKNCVALMGARFTSDKKGFYSLLIYHIFIKGFDSNLVTRNKKNK